MLLVKPKSEVKIKASTHSSMASTLHLVGIVFLVFGGALSHASPQPDLGLTIHAPFSSPVYITKESKTSENSQVEDGQEHGKREAAGCEILNTAESGVGLHEVKTVAKRSFSFFVKPESSFKKIVFRLNLQNILSLSSGFHSDEAIALSSEDLSRSGSSQWTQVRVEYSKYERPGLDRHAFNVSYDNVTNFQVTHDSWWFSGFRGFTVFAEGGAQVLFSCVPSDFDEAPVRGYVFYGIWVMAGLLIVATFLLATLCIVWVYLKYQGKKKHVPVVPVTHPVYEEFDEEVLERIKQKVEALRSGKSQTDLDTVVVSYAPRQENHYVLEESGYGELEGVSPTEHHYEDIDKFYQRQLPVESVYQNLSNAENISQNMPVVDNIYESLPCFEDHLGKRSAVTTSPGYRQSSLKSSQRA